MRHDVRRSRRELALLLLTSAVAACGSEAIGPPPDEAMTLVAADVSGTVYTVDETSGAETRLRDTFFLKTYPGYPPISVLLRTGFVSSMAWIYQTDSWWLGTGATANCEACILTFDPAADSAKVVRQVSEVTGLADFAVHPTSGRIYAFQSDGSGYLFKIDPRDGSVTEVMSALDEGRHGKGTTFSQDGLLYVAGDGGLTRIRLSLREAVAVGTFSYVGFPPFASVAKTIDAMTTRPSDGVVFGLLADGGGASAGSTVRTYLVTIDLETAVVMNVGPNSTILDGLAFVPTRLLD